MSPDAISPVRDFLAGLRHAGRIADADHLTAGETAGIVLALAAQSAGQIIACLPDWACAVEASGILVVAEKPTGGHGDAKLRTALGRYFRHVATVQQRGLHGSLLCDDRHAASRILALAAPVRVAPDRLIHLASNDTLPDIGSMFLQTGDPPDTLPRLMSASPPKPCPAPAPTTARTTAAALVERLMDKDALLFQQRQDIAQLRRSLDAAPSTARPGPFAMPNALHAWPLAANRVGRMDAYDQRVDDDVLLEADAGAAYLRRFALLGDAPLFDDAIASLNAASHDAALAQPEVSIIIPVYGQLAATLSCLDSLFALTSAVTAEIIVIDDASPDDSADLLARIHGIRLLRQSENHGFIASCNAGASAARGHFVLFLNNDTRVVTGWLDALVRSFAQFPHAGLVGSKMLYPDGSLQEAGGIIWRDGSCWNDGRNDDPNRPHYCHARRVDYVSGCSIMLPSALFKRLGGFDTHFAPAYCEDADLAMRVRAMGHEVWFQPQSRVVHDEGRTSGTDTTQGVKAHQVVNSRKLFLRWRCDLAMHRPNGQAPFLERDRTTRLRALVVDATTPTPLQDAGSVTTTLTLSLFQQLGYQAHFVPQDNFLFQPGHSTDLMQAGVDVAYAPYEANFEDYLRRHGPRFDVVLVYRVTVLEQVIDTLRRFAPQAPILFHTMDLHFLRMERKARQHSDVTALAEAAAMRQRELALIRRVDCTITHSTYEQALLHAEAPNAPVVVWPFMFPFHGTKTGFTDRKDFCFLGGYNHTPNVDAVTFFVRDVLPLIHRQIPDARFIIAGANPTAEVLALAGPHVTVTGQIDDLRSVFDSVRVFACSLRIGAGTKGKISTAMSYGLPVVSTSCGAEGMELREGCDVLLADTAKEFANACLRLHQDPKLWQILSDQGQDLVQEKHSLAMGKRVLDDAIQTALRHHLGLDQNGMATP